MIFLFKNNIPLPRIGGKDMATEESTLQISGMTCTACAASIEKGISKIDGVEKANVNFALERTTVVYDPNKTNVEEFKEKVKDLGYEVIHQKAEFDISGMTCAVCATKIEKRISKMEGVSNANVNFALETISVAYDDKKVKTSDMVSAVKKLGYGLIPKQSSEDKMGHQEAEIKKQYRKFIFSAILTLPRSEEHTSEL